MELLIPRIRHLIATIFPAPEKSEKMTAGERILLGGVLVLGLVALIYFTGDWGPGFYWGGYSVFSHLDIYCPACGGSQSAYNLIRGNFSLAWQYNQMFILSLPLIFWGGFTALRAVVTGWPITGKYLHPVLIWGYLAAVILFGILRNIPMEIFECLRPPA